MDIQQLPETIKQTIEVLSDKLSTPTEQLLSFAVHGVRVEGIVSVVSGITLFLTTFYCAKKLVKFIFNDDFHEEVRSGVGIFGVIIIIILFSLSAKCFYFGSIQAFAPEYWILKSVLGL